MKHITATASTATPMVRAILLEGMKIYSDVCLLGVRPLAPQGVLA